MSDARAAADILSPRRRGEEGARRAQHDGKVRGWRSCRNGNAAPHPAAAARRPPSPRLRGEKAGDPRPDSGFTILEVLVALAILSVSLGLVLGAFSDGMGHLREGERRHIASAYAQSLLAAAGVVQALRDGETHGELPDGFAWRLSVAPYGTAADANAWSLSARQVTAVVSWRTGDAEHAVRLTTLRLLPKSTSP